MSGRILYQDRVVALSEDAMVLRGFTKVFARPRRVRLDQIRSFRLRSETEFPDGRLPKWGVDDRGVWYTRDSRRWKRKESVEVTFLNGETVGFSPAHPQRFKELLQNLGLSLGD